MRNIILLLLLHSLASAQKPGQPKDTFAINILGTVDKVLRLAEDPKRPAFELAGEPIKVGYNGATLYNSAIQLPGAVNTQFEQVYTSRSSDATQWQWQANLIDLSKERADGAGVALKAKLDSLLSFFKSRKRTALPDGEWELITNTWSSSPQHKNDGAMLIIGMKKKLHNSEQQAVDSLVKLYQPLMTDPKIAYHKATTFVNAFRLEDISEQKVREAYLNSIKQVVNINVESAYNMMLSAPYFMKMEDIVMHLTESQKTRVRELASRDLAAYYGTDNSPRDPVIEKKKEIKEKQPPSDPCEREIWELTIKPGYYVSGNGRVAYVRDYNCTNDNYSIFYLNAEGKRLVNESVSISGMQSYRQTSSAPFVICSNCRGIGYSMEYDWYKTNVAGNTYAHSNDQRKYTCGVCSGSGFIKVR